MLRYKWPINLENYWFVYRGKSFLSQAFNIMFHHAVGSRDMKERSRKWYDGMIWNQQSLVVTFNLKRFHRIKPSLFTKFWNRLKRNLSFALIWISVCFEKKLLQSVEDWPFNGKNNEKLIFPSFVFISLESADWIARRTWLKVFIRCLNKTFAKLRSKQKLIFKVNGKVIEGVGGYYRDEKLDIA